ncbi:MAG: STAS domain-containing protein [Cyanobium sp.]
MNSLHPQATVAASSQVPLSIVGHVIVAHLIDNFDQADVDLLETRLLDNLNSQRELKGVVFNFSEVSTTDRLDLARLQATFKAVKLIGRSVGLCGINPGLAAVIINAGLDFHHESIGHELEDLIPLR